MPIYEIYAIEIYDIHSAVGISAIWVGKDLRRHDT